MDVDVRAGRAEHALVRPEQGSDDGGIGLRAADQEMDVGVRAVEDEADHLGRFRAMGIFPVAGGLLQVCRLKGLEDLRTASFQVVAFEVEH